MSEYAVEKRETAPKNFFAGDFPNRDGRQESRRTRGRQLQSKNNICGVFRRWAGRTAGTSQSDVESAQRIEESRDNRRRSICFGTAAGIYRISRHHAAILHGRNGDKLEYASHAT